MSNSNKIVSTWLEEDFEERAAELGMTAAELMEKLGKVFEDRLTELGNEVISDLEIF